MVFGFEESIEVGDEVQYKEDVFKDVPYDYPSETFTVACVHESKVFFFGSESKWHGRGAPCHVHNTYWLASKKDLIKTSSKPIMAKLTEKMALIFKGEPEKSFIKAGVMNTDETLTTDGQAVFLAWLLKENGTKFKTDVVDPILAEEKAAQ